MKRYLKQFAEESPRILLFTLMAIGILAPQAGGGTFAYFTSSATGGANQFQGGTLEIGTSTLTTTSFAWTTSKGGNNCGTTLAAGTLISNQKMTPGDFCNAPLTIINSGDIDAWLRVRIVRSAGSGANAGNLNRALMLYMHQYSTQALRDSECGSGNLVYKPNASTNAGTISSVSGPPSRTALTTLGTGGKALGATQLTSGAAGLNITGTTGGVPTEANMTSGTYYNIIGNDTVDGAGAGTTAEATLAAGATNYYCIALFFPSDGGLSQGNSGGDNATAGGDNTYYIHAMAAQKSGR